jgi:hypothetical protein
MMDLRGKLPTNPRGRNGGRRTRKQIKTVGLHYGGLLAAGYNAGVEAEIKILRGYAQYHAFVRDWSSDGSGLRHDTIAYCIAVGNSGTKYLLNDPERIGWHIKHGNVESIGVLWIGGKGQTPSAAAYAGIEEVCDWIVEDPAFSAGRRDVWGHGECGGQYGGGPVWYGNSTECPWPDILAWGRAYRKGQPAPEPLPTPAPPPTTHTFYPETGFSVGFAIRAAYLALGGPHGKPGGFAIGFPISDEFSGRIPDGGDKLYTLQCFERAVAHWHPTEGVGWLRTGPMIRSVLEMQGLLPALE